MTNPVLPFYLKFNIGQHNSRLIFITPVKGHWMHLNVSYNVKTLLSAQRRNAAALRKPFKKPSNQDALHLPPQRATDLGSHQAAKSFKAVKVCDVETQPVGQEALKLRPPNLMASLCFLYDCQVGNMTSES